MRTWVQDIRAALRIGLRGILRRPVQSIAVVCTMAVGIGVTVGVGSVLYTVLFAPLPYPEAGEIRQVTWQEEGRRGQMMSSARTRTLDEATEGVAAVGVARFRDLSLRVGDLPRRVRGVVTTAETFELLGVSASLGRLPTADDDRPGGPCGVLLSRDLWKEAFAADREAVGRSVRLDGSPCVVLGVMPAEFEFPAPYFAPGEAWVLAGSVGVDWAAPGPGFLAFVRARPGVTDGAVEAAIDVASTELPGSGVFALTAWSEASRESSSRRLSVLLAASALVLLLATLNVLMLRLARGWEWGDEVRTRVALGAGYGRVLGLLGVESLILTAMGAALGVGVATGVLGLIVRLRSFYIPRMEEAAMGLGELIACILLAAVIGAVGAVGPAVQAWRHAQGNIGRGPQRGTSTRGRRRAGRVLIVVESTLALVLLAGAALLLESYRSRVEVDPGFDPVNLLHARITPSVALGGDGAGESGPPAAFYRELEERLAAEPGLASVTLASIPPGVGEGPTEPIQVLGGGAEDGDAAPRTIWRPTSASYFDVLGVRLREGRDLRSGVERGVVVNEAFVERILGGGPAIGRTLVRLSRQGSTGSSTPAEAETPWQIVGVAPDIGEQFAYLPAPPTVYLHLDEDAPNSVAVLARTRGAPLDQAPALRAAVADVAGDQPVYALRTFTFMLDSEYDLNRLALTLLALFAGAAIVLAMAGIYGVVSQAVGLRRREIGVRIAVGAARDRVRWALLWDNGWAVSIGAIFGLVVVLAAGDTLRSLTPLFTGLNPVILSLAALIVVAAGTLSCYLPANRASRVDPARILRGE